MPQPTPSPHADPQIEFRSVSFHPGESAPQILDRVSFAVHSGRVLALIGRSGAGKSTILKLTNGLLLPTSGDVLVERRNTRQWQPYELRRHAGYVMQEVGLFPHLTVEQNVGVVPRLIGWPPDRIRERAHQLLALVGLPPAQFAHRWPSELSGGQRQRAGVARALAVDPPILLMDEPFGALDPITRAEMQGEFSRIQSELHKTVLMVTHDMDEALALGDSVGVLEHGRLVACDTPEAIVHSDDATVQALFAPARLKPRPTSRQG